MSYLTGETSVSGIEPETCFQSFGDHTKALVLSLWTYSFRWVPNHQEPEKHLEKIHWCWPGSNPGHLISSLKLYPLCHHALLTDVVKHFILILYIFIYYHLQYTPLLYSYNAPCESSIVRNSAESILLPASSGCVPLSLSQLQRTQILFPLMQILPYETDRSRTAQNPAKKADSLTLECCT